MALRLNNQTAALRVCIDSIADNRISGQVTGKRLNAPICFSDINNFVVQLDALLDVQRFPQAFQRIRSFTNKKSPAVPAAMTMEEIGRACGEKEPFGAHATFLLYIFSRQNASWQGAIDWLDGSGRQPFSSTLEFMRLTAEKLGL